MKLHTGSSGTGSTSAESKLTTAPLGYVQLFISALSVPNSPFAGRQLSARASVVFQQLFPASQAQSRLAADEWPPSLLLPEQPIPKGTAASTANTIRIFAKISSTFAEVNRIDPAMSSGASEGATCRSLSASKTDARVSDAISSGREREPPAKCRRYRLQIGCGRRDPSAFRAALLGVPPADRDAWLDRVLGLDDVPEDGPELPKGCVPYLPCPVDALLRVVEHAPVRASDVFVDVGSGVGRAAAFVHLLTGASAIGIEIQPRLVRASRELAARLPESRITCVDGDATELADDMTIGSVFLLYCPFSGERLTKLLSDLEPISRTRTIRVCCVDLPLPSCGWLRLEASLGGDLTIYESSWTR